MVANADRGRLKFVTQCHHILPRCYYKFLGLPIDEQGSNRVNLTYVDHLKAHSLLVDCSLEPLATRLRYAVHLLLRGNKFPAELQNAEEYNCLYSRWKEEAAGRWHEAHPEIQNWSPSHWLGETLSQMLARISKADIERYYIQEGHSYYETAAYFEISPSAFDKVRATYRIPSLKPSYTTYTSQCSSEDLFHQYIELGKSRSSVVEHA